MPGAAKTASPLTSTVGSKVIMAITGFILFGYLCAHVTGNLMIFLGADYINDWAHFLHSRTMTFTLLGARCVLLGAFLLHVFYALKLTFLGWAARPEGYAVQARARVNVAPRLMIWTGPLIALFLVVHILHLTVGSVHPKFDAHNAYGNVVIGFGSPPMIFLYVVAVVGVGFHLSHGIWSMLQTVGLNGAKWDCRIRIVAVILSVGIVLGFISVPFAVLAGIVSLP